MHDIIHYFIVLVTHDCANAQFAVLLLSLNTVYVVQCGEVATYGCVAH